MKRIGKAGWWAGAAAALAVLAADVPGDHPLWIEGNSTMHPYKAQATLLTLDAEKGTLTIPIAGLKSGDGGLDENMHKALKAGEHPVIRFVKGAHGWAPSSQASRLTLAGQLTIAGKAKDIVVEAGVVREAGGVRLTGSHALLMKDYGIDPPSMMFGLISTDNRVVVKFNLTLGGGTLP